MKWQGETSAQRRERLCNEVQRSYAWWPTQMGDGTWVWLDHYFWFLWGMHVVPHRFEKHCDAYQAMQRMNRGPQTPPPPRTR